MSDNTKFIGVGPDFGNECCICEGVGSNLSGAISLARPNVPGTEFCISHVGGAFAGCFGEILIRGEGECANTGTQVTAVCDGELYYFYLSSIRDQTVNPGCATLTAVDQGDPYIGSQTCLDECSDFKLLCHSEACTPECTRGINLYGDVADLSQPCFPYTCCPCPETGNYGVSASIVIEGCSGGDLNTTINMDKADGIAICSGMTFGQTDTCYKNIVTGDLGPYVLIDKPYEKFGKYSGLLCSPNDAGCSGQEISLSLCCCDNSVSTVKPSGTGECHMCNYQLSMRFEPRSGEDGSNGIADYCYCPTGYYDNAGLLSYNQNSEETVFHQFNLVDASCEPFYLEFEATGLYYNCDCCLGGMEDDDNDISITVTIA